MSAYIVEKDTINEIVGACVTYGLASVEIGDVVGQILWDANRAAVAYRYGEKVTEAEYSYYPTPATIGQRAMPQVASRLGVCGTNQTGLS